MHIAHCTAALHTENEWPGKPTFFLGKKNLAIASGWSHVGWAGINYGYWCHHRSKDFSGCIRLSNEQCSRSDFTSLSLNSSASNYHFTEQSYENAAQNIPVSDTYLWGDIPASGTPHRETPASRPW